jgi:D-3-phosphoglycerate dehydrogenase
MEQFAEFGHTNHIDYTSSKVEVAAKIHNYDGFIIRSRFKIDADFLAKATKLKFIGRVGAGLENIDCEFAEQQGIKLISAPEGNRNAVGEHALGMLLSLFNKLNKADREVRDGKWLREANRGVELDGQTVGIIGYGNMGKAFAKKLRGFDVDVLFHDLKDDIGDENATQVSLAELQKRATVLSLHTPQTPLTINMINKEFIAAFQHNFWLLNTARGKSVVTQDLVAALQSGKILGAGLDVLEYEKSSFENLFQDDQMPAAFQYLIQAENVLLSPHVAGWTVESKEKLAQTIVDKFKVHFH